MSPDWVTQTQAAERETRAGRPLSQGNVSRYLARWPGEVPVRRDDKGRVTHLCYAAFAAHRAGNLGVQDKRATLAAALASDPPPPLPLQARAPATQTAPSLSPAAVDPRAAEASTRKRLAEAERAEIALQEQKRLLIPRQAAVRAVETAGARFVQQLERRRRTLAQRLVGLESVRDVETLLKTADRELLEALVGDLSRAAAGLSAPDSAEDEGQHAPASSDSGLFPAAEPLFS